MKKKWILSFALSASIFGSVSLASATTLADFNLPDDIKGQVEQLSQMIESKQAGANDAVVALVKKNKDVASVMAIGRYFMDKGQTKAAVACAERAYKIDSKNTDVLIFVGDAYLSDGDKGMAGQKYEEAIYNDENCSEAYISKARLYKHINATIAKETLLDLKNRGVKSAEIDRELASVYYQLNDISNAIETYKIYFAAEPKANLEAKKEYAICQYLNKDYAGSIATIDEVIGQSPKDLSLNRMKFYNLVEENKLEEAKAASNNLFGQYNDTLYNFNDYAQRARLYVKLKDYSSAIPDFEKSISLNENKVDIYKELSDAYERQNEFDKAISAFKTYIDKAGENASLNDTRDYGKVFYSAAIYAKEKNELEKMKVYISEGDTIFAEVGNKSDSYVGPIYRARINAVADSENPIESAKNYYAEAIKRMEGKGDAYNDNRKECYRYFIFYYIKKDDNATAKAYISKILEIDPSNAWAKEIQAALK